jgi:hypothetical protein
MGDRERGEAIPQPHAPADPYDIGAGSQIGQERDSDHDGLTDVFEKLANSSAAPADTDRNQPSDAEELSLASDPSSAESNVDGSYGPETSYQDDPLSDLHGGPWNQSLPGGAGGPQPDQGGIPAPQPHPGGLGGPRPDQDSLDPASSDHLDNTGPLDLN